MMFINKMPEHKLNMLLDIMERENTTHFLFPKGDLFAVFTVKKKFVNLLESH